MQLILRTTYKEGILNDRSSTDSRIFISYWWISYWFKMFIENKKVDREDQDAAIKRVGYEAGKIVRRTIVIAVLFGTIIAPFILPFFGIPTVVEIKSTIKPFLGFIGGGDDVQFHNVYGYLFTEENRQILLTIVGFYFGNAAGKAST